MYILENYYNRLLNYFDICENIIFYLVIRVILLFSGLLLFLQLFGILNFLIIFVLPSVFGLGYTLGVDLYNIDYIPGIAFIRNIFQRIFRFFNLFAQPQAVEPVQPEQLVNFEFLDEFIEDEPPIMAQQPPPQYHGLDTSEAAVLSAMNAYRYTDLVRAINRVQRAALGTQQGRDQALTYLDGAILPAPLFDNAHPDVRMPAGVYVSEADPVWAAHLANLRGLLSIRFREEHLAEQQAGAAGTSTNGQTRQMMNDVMRSTTTQIVSMLSYATSIGSRSTREELELKYRLDWH